MPNLCAVKHEVSDAEAQEQTHPMFDPMLEQFERFTQMIQRLRRRKVLVKLPERERVYRLRVEKVPQARLSAERLEEIKKALAKMVGKSCATIQQEITERAQRHGVPLYAQQPQVSYTFTKGENFWEVRK
jgi:hypothetical protein